MDNQSQFFYSSIFKFSISPKNYHFSSLDWAFKLICEKSGDRTTWWLSQKDAEIDRERSLRLETERKLSEELDQRLAQQAQVYEQKLNEQAQQHQAIMEQQAQRIAKLEQLMSDELSQQKAKTKPNSFFSEVNSLTPNGSQPSKKAKGFGNLAMAKSGTNHQG